MIFQDVNNCSFILYLRLTITSVLLNIKYICSLLSVCPELMPYAFANGKRCCSHYKAKDSCGGNQLEITSDENCCRQESHTNCPDEVCSNHPMADSKYKLVQEKLCIKIK